MAAQGFEAALGRLDFVLGQRVDQLMQALPGQRFHGWRSVDGGHRVPR